MPRLDHTAFVNSRRDERSLGHHTLRAYAQDLRTFARFTKAHHLSDPLSKDDILAYHRHLRDELCALPSPFADVRISVRIPRRLPRTFDRETLRAVVVYGKSQSAVRPMSGTDAMVPVSQSAVTLLIIKLLIVTGLRISELTNLKVRDVSPDGSQILVNGKGSKERIVFVPNRGLQEEFQRYCQLRSENGSMTSPLFLNTAGRRLRAATFRKRLRALSKRLGIEPHLTPHRFRHSAATLLIEEGIDIRMVQALLGHANLKTTEIYVRVTNHALQRALERVDVLSELR